MATPRPVEGKVALVVGAASGIGRATAIMLAKSGAIVWWADRNADGAVATAASIGGKYASLDVTREGDWDTVIAAVLKQHGRPDVRVNSAGINFACPVAEMSLEDWRRVMQVNLQGIFLCTKHGLRALRASGGRIANVSSAASLEAWPRASAFPTRNAAGGMF